MSSKLATVFKHIRRTPYQALAAVAVTTITFFVISVFATLVVAGEKILKYLESRPAVTAFFLDSATQDNVKSLRTKLEATGVTEEIKYISKDEALAIYREQNKDNPMLLEMVTADILPASLEVNAKSVDELENLAAIMKSDASVEEVVYQKTIVDTLESWTKGLRLATIALSLVFLATSILIVTIILSLKTAARKEEIYILSLLGASTWYIKSPFLLEGMVYGSLGALLGWSSSFLLLLYLTPNIVGFLQAIPVLPFPYYITLSLLGAQMLLGIILGMVASMLATRRYNR